MQWQMEDDDEEKEWIEKNGDWESEDVSGVKKLYIHACAHYSLLLPVPVLHTSHCLFTEIVFTFYLVHK
jgi:hypothetical protein